MKKFQILFSIVLMLGLLVSSFGVAYADDTEPTEEDTAIQNPVAGYLATLTGLTPEEILDLQAEGFGMGEIAKAYYLLSMTQEPIEEPEPLEGEETEPTEETEPEPFTVTYEQLLDALSGGQEMGWGVYFMEQGIHPGDHGGVGWLFQKGKKMQLEEGETLQLGKPDKQNGPPEHANNDKDKVKGPKK